MLLYLKSLRICWRALTIAQVLLAMAQVASAAEPEGSASPQLDFSRQIRPLFVEHCYQCHGPDKQEGGLRLDVRSNALKGGDTGPLFLAGKSSASELVLRIIASDDDQRMPPPDAKAKPLAAAEIQAITAWVDQGAVWPEGSETSSGHWAFQPLVRHEPPAVKNTAWIRNAIDRFVLAKLESRGIEPSAEADHYTLIKRLSYDLIGLPPRPDEVEAFVRDDTPDAYEKLVNRLLESPHFGERWGRHWLDMARYADSDGYEKDNPRPDAWRFRDWVIDAVNSDLPFDQFTYQQLAGDLLPQATPSQRLATAFHRQTLTNTEGGADQEQFRVEAIFDRVATTGSVWLGLTIGCAQCHSHKYDPITQREYYQLFAFFNNGDEVEVEVPLVGEPLAKWTREKGEAEHKLAELEPKLAQSRAELTVKLPAWEAELRERIAKASPVAFHPVELLGAQSSAGSEIKLLSDGSYLLGGKNPEVDKITISLKTTLAEITGFRLETLADDSLAGRGPGRAGHGNFVLGEFRAFAAPTDQIGEEHRVELAHADADFAQHQFPAADAIDGKEQTGWAISPQMGHDHWAMFIAKEPIHADKTPWLRVVLSQNHGQQHTIGRFRMMAVAGRDPQLGIPQNVRDILAMPAAQRTPEQAAALLDYYLAQDPTTKELADKIEKLKARTASKPVMKARVIAERTANLRKSAVLHRGDFLQPAEEVQPAVLSVLPSMTSPLAVGTASRLDLARWLVAADNPLTPRVTVNHWWSYLFGRGIVRTANDFGVRGDRPTHPELLEWLSGELVGRQWSRKEMIRLIVASATYRQASRSRPELADIDPLNDSFYRQNRYRVEGEIVRDLALAVSGLLSEKVGGPSIFPPLPASIAELSYAGNFKWTNSTGEDRYRRGMYTFFKRTAPHPNLTTFDCPDSNTTTIQRRVSNTPLQALATLNNEVFIEAAQAMAKRLLSAELANDDERLALALRWCLARPAASEELTNFGELLTASRQWYAEHAVDAPAVVGPFQTAGVPVPEAAAWVATTRMIMNLDEFLTRE